MKNTSKLLCSSQSETQEKRGSLVQANKYLLSVLVQKTILPGIAVTIQLIFHFVGALALIYGLGMKERNTSFVGLFLMVISSVMMLYGTDLTIREIPGLFGPGILLITLPIASLLGIVIRRRLNLNRADDTALSAEELDEMEFE